jgi:phospholipase C
MRFIEDNWRLPRLGNGSTDATAGSLEAMFDFDRAGTNPPLFLDPSTGESTRAERR